ncbi:hypothetical protein ANO11243_032150 [Dothideomycetidae sp. 11243]|nr:hypothetical protein ANO11243_032150 [fungal sp. No.11243]
MQGKRCYERSASRQQDKTTDGKGEARRTATTTGRWGARRALMPPGSGIPPVDGSTVAMGGKPAPSDRKSGLGKAPGFLAFWPKLPDLSPSGPSGRLPGWPGAGFARDHLV